MQSVLGLHWKGFGVTFRGHFWLGLNKKTGSRPVFQAEKDQWDRERPSILIRHSRGPVS